MNIEQYNPHQGDKTNAQWLMYQLQYLEQVITKDGVGRWLYRSNPVLDGLSPIAVIIEREGDTGFKIVGDLISDMITGSPS
jgi:hypothetical protein